MPALLADLNVCSRCKHWHKIPNNPENRGRCHGAPPSAAVLPGPNGGLIDISVWPSTAPDETCGSYSPRIIIP